MHALIIDAAHAAGCLLMEKFEQGVRVDYKGDYDLVTEADRAAEAAIVEIIRARYPQHDILAEEGVYANFGAEHCWIIDPLDGTTNYAHGFPWFAVSIALEIRGAVCLGVIHNPYVGETYFAEKGEGAFLNQRQLRVSTTERLDQALLATGFAYDHKTADVNNYDHFEHFQMTARGVRRPGAASLDLACIAAGRFDGFWEMNLKPWDIAAGTLLVAEAGGIVTDFDGLPMPLDRKECLASNGLIHTAMQELIGKGRRLPLPDPAAVGRTV